MPRVRTLVVLYVLIGVVAGVVSDLAGASQNLSVYRSAALAMLHSQPLYERFSWDFDFYKYGPAFAFAFLPLALLPWHVSAVVWSAGNFAVGAYGMARFARTVWAHEDEAKREWRASALLLWSLPGIVLTTDGDQSNLLVAGAALLACTAYLENRERAAAPWLAFAILVKIFPAALGALALTTHRKVRAVGWLGAVTALFAISPVVLVGPARLWAYHVEWRGMLSGDHGNVQAPWSHWSVMHALDACGVHGTDLVIQVLGTAVFLLSAALFVRNANLSRTSEPERRRLGLAFVACTLSFVLLFNHRSESPTYVLSGIAAGAFLLALPERRAWHWVLYVLVVLGPSPIYSDYTTPGLLGALAAKRLFHPLRVVPLLALWGVLTAMVVAPGRRSGTLQEP